MAYSKFTLELLSERFGLRYVQADTLFPSVAPVTPSPLLQETLHNNLPVVLAFGSERSRSELLVSPVLLEVRRQLGLQVSLFPGVEFNVDRSQGLDGFCDYLISASAIQFTVQAPVIALVEAKKGDLSSGLAQCLAEMVAALRFNQRHDKTVETVYGAVTSGTDWKFLSLHETTATIALQEYDISEIESILGIFVRMLRKESTL
ncbi:hypothetical protein [Armatimonas sp.]|uniref:hypothetical protein n=1 Tax=Armatimonas sp. TaxID=1872638 RepID=UPI0037528A0F